jgi:hypothetical protein
VGIVRRIWGVIAKCQHEAPSADQFDIIDFVSDFNGERWEDKVVRCTKCGKKLFRRYERKTAMTKRSD